MFPTGEPTEAKLTLRFPCGRDRAAAAAGSQETKFGSAPSDRGAVPRLS